MSIKLQALKPILIVLSLLLLNACSESSPENIGEPNPQADPVLRPHLTLDGDLANYEIPQNETITLGTTGEINFGPEILIRGEDIDLFIALDTDIPTSLALNRDRYTEHTVLPEFFIYTTGQQLLLYDFASRHPHPLVDFSSPNDATIPQGTICDLRKVITLDKQSFDRGEIILKEEFSAYVVLSSSHDCSVPSHFFKLEINASERKRDTFNVNKTHLVLKANTDSDDPLISSANDPVIDREQPHWLLQHALNLKDEDESEFNAYIKKIDISSKTKVRAHTFKKYLAKLRDVDPVLVYADTPVIDKTNLRVGYLGLDPLTRQLGFFAHNVSTKRNTKLWQIEVPMPSEGVPAAPLFPVVNWMEHTLLSGENKPYRHYSGPDFVLAEMGWNLIKFTYDELFNDDRQSDRENRLTQPFFARTPSTEFETLDLDTDPTSGSMAILDRGDIHNGSVHFSIEGANPILIKRFTEPGLTDVKILTSPNRIFLTKSYNNGRTALTTLNTPRPGLASIESTLIPTSLAGMNWKLFKIGQTVIMNTVSYETQEMNAYDLTAATSNLSDQNALPNSIFVRIKDSRFFAGESEYWGLLYSDNASSWGDYLDNPRLYKYQSGQPGGRADADGNPELDSDNDGNNTGDSMLLNSSFTSFFSDTWGARVPTLRLISEQEKSDDLSTPYELSTWAYRYRNFAEYEFFTADDQRLSFIGEKLDTGFFAIPTEDTDDEEN